MHKLIVPALAALSLAVLPAQAPAQTTTITVPIADLDLSTEAGRATLEGRVRAAIVRICGTVEVRNIRQSADREKCRVETEASARAAIARVTANDPALAINR